MPGSRLGATTPKLGCLCWAPDVGGVSMCRGVRMMGRPHKAGLAAWYPFTLQRQRLITQPGSISSSGRHWRLGQRRAPHNLSGMDFPLLLTLTFSVGNGLPEVLPFKFLILHPYLNTKTYTFSFITLSVWITVMLICSDWNKIQVEPPSKNLYDNYNNVPEDPESVEAL